MTKLAWCVPAFLLASKPKKIMNFLIILSALLLDRLFGEPPRYHPLVGFGNSANWVERKLNVIVSARLAILTGAVATVSLLMPYMATVLILKELAGGFSIFLDVVVVYWAIGARSLEEHVLAVHKALSLDSLATARDKLSRIVSRSTNTLDIQQVNAAAVETTLENGNDAIFAIIFWYAVGGAPMVIAYRLINTLDAMWGYRSPKFEHFGKAAARVDDLLNLIPARLTAFSYALLGKTTAALQSWKNDASGLASPNAGPVMTAGAGSLELTLGGPANYPNYQNKTGQKPFYGGHNPPQTEDILRALNLVNRTTFLWLMVIAFSSLIWFFINHSNAV